MTSPAPALAIRRRRIIGQHATRGDVADLTSALCIRRATDRVLDPACGEGVFLDRAARRQLSLGAKAPAVAGVEIDPRLAAAASRRVPAAAICNGDFLRLAAQPRESRAAPLDAPFDVILGNPPYVRHELIGRERKRELAALAGSRGWPALPGRSDLHGWFWGPALSFLEQGGRLGWVVSATWLDAGYGEPLRAWLLRRATLRMVIESQVESWFDAARVPTVIVVLEAGAARGRDARFVRLTRRLDEVAPLSLPAAARRARLEDLARAMGSSATRGDGWSAIDVDRAGLSRRWGAPLAETAAARELASLAGGRLVALEEVAGVRWGIKTGDDAVFFPRADQAPAMEPGLLVPAVFSLMELDRLVVARGPLRRRLLVLDTRRRAHRALLGRRDTVVAAWLRRARRERGTHRRPTCAAREGRRPPGKGSGVSPESPRRWFELRPRPPGAILWSIMHQYRHLAPLNPRGFPANDNLLLIDPLPGTDAIVLAALLNSHVQALLARGAGRRRNEGMLKTQASDVRRMPVPDPRRLTSRHAAAIRRAFLPLLRRPIGTVTQESARADRLALDRAVLRGMGLSDRPARAMALRIAAELRALHAGEKTRESDAVRQRRKGHVTRAGAPG